VAVSGDLASCNGAGKFQNPIEIGSQLKKYLINLPASLLRRKLVCAQNAFEISYETHTSKCPAILGNH